MSDRTPEQEGTLTPQYKNYKRQKCFVAYSEQAPWTPDLLSACDEVLKRPEFDLELDYARQHFEPDITLRQKALDLIANARYGIYDLSYWTDDEGKWQMPRNVFIELGMAIGLNRPMLLLRHTSNRELELPGCLQGLAGQVVEYGGDVSLKLRLAERLPQWINSAPERDWWNRYCVFGGRKCEYRERYPRSGALGEGVWPCLLSHGLDADRVDFQCAVEEILQRYDKIRVISLNEFLTPKGYDFELCASCQEARSAPFSIHRITSRTSAACFVAIGLSIAIEAQFAYWTPKVLFAEKPEDVPSLLAGYEVAVARNNTERRAKLKAFMPLVMQQVSEAAWKPKLLPFVEISTSNTPGKSPGAGGVGHPDLRDSMRTIVQGAREALGSDIVTLYVYDEQISRFTEWEVEPDTVLSASPPSALGASSVVSRILAMGDTPYYFAEDASSDPLLGGSFVREVGIRTAIGCRLSMRDRAVGVMFLNYLTPHRFTTDDLLTIKQFANQAAIAIANAQDYMASQRRARLLQALQEASRAIASKLTLQDTLDEIARQALDLVGAREAGAFSHLTLKTGDKLLVWAVSDPETLAGLQTMIGAMDIADTPQSGITGRAARTGESQNVFDVQKDPQYIAYREQTRSELAVPIVIEDRIMGVINVESPKQEAFDDWDIQALQSFAAQAAVAIQSARRLEHVRIVSEIGRMAAKQLDFEGFLHTLFAQLKEVFDRLNLIVYLTWATYDNALNALVTYPTEFYPIQSEPRVDKLSKNGIMTRVARRREKYYADNVKNDRDYFEVTANVRSEFCVPVLFGGELLGVFDLESPVPDAFDPEHRELVETIADQVAATIRRLTREEGWTAPYDEDAQNEENEERDRS